MGRMYTVSFENVTVSAAQDLFEINPASNKPIKLHQVVISQVNLEVAEQLRMNIKRITASFASGSGGGTATVAKIDPGDATASFTAERNNTTRATGTAEILWPEGQDQRIGLNYLPTPEQRPIFVNGNPLIVGLENAPPSVSMSGVAVVEEIG